MTKLEILKSLNIVKVKKERFAKLISGKMNIPYIICKAGYALGANKPLKQKAAKVFNPCIVLRKAA